MKIHKTYKFKLKTITRMQHKLTTQNSVFHFTWNKSLALPKKCFKLCCKVPFYIRLAHLFIKWKKKPKYKFLKRIHTQAIQQEREDIFELEHLEDAYLVRWYKKAKTLKYSGIISIAKRGKGEYEILGWVRPKEADAGYQLRLLPKLEDKLREVADDFKYLTGTIENKKLPIQQRLWRSKYKLIPLYQVKKVFNNELLEATYVKFERI